MSKKTRLLSDAIALIQSELNAKIDLANDLETQLRECKAQLKATDEEAAELMKENAKLRRAIEAVINRGNSNKDQRQAIFDREMNA